MNGNEVRTGVRTPVKVNVRRLEEGRKVLGMGKGKVRGPIPRKRKGSDLGSDQTRIQDFFRKVDKPGIQGATGQTVVNLKSRTTVNPKLVGLGKSWEGREGRRPATALERWLHLTGGQELNIVRGPGRTREGVMEGSNDGLGKEEDLLTREREEERNTGMKRM